MKKLIRFVFAVAIVFILPLLYVVQAINWAFDMDAEPFPIKSLISELTFGYFFKDGE